MRIGSAHAAILPIPRSPVSIDHEEDVPASTWSPTDDPDLRHGAVLGRAHGGSPSSSPPAPATTSPGDSRVSPTATRSSIDLAGHRRGDEAARLGSSLLGRTAKRGTIAEAVVATGSRAQVQPTRRPGRFGMHGVRRPSISTSMRIRGPPRGRRATPSVPSSPKAKAAGSTGRSVVHGPRSWPSARRAWRVRGPGGRRVEPTDWHRGPAPSRLGPVGSPAATSPPAVPRRAAARRRPGSAVLGAGASRDR